ncbi:Zinc finger protein ZPR1 [Colletotrichum sojae]|uniref:Zinc finger protein ZPR1 n=1 Tax=Colletotrichum sojae TaxID=2175907 RepID=A0A8H6JCG4_9PEZI|nr:Zinc finger protein ZPR1 [Colletotrichum sojae]
MDVSTLPTHLNFLNDAAHLLRASALETSAYLMNHHNELMFLNDVELSDTRRQHVCGACGHIMIPGQGTTLKLETEKAFKKRRSTKAKANAPKDEAEQRRGMHKLFTCGHCTHTTKVSFPPPHPVVRRRTKVEKVSAKNQQPAAAEPAKPATANSSSKKRAKNRKAGLQALLSQAKTSSSSGRSLSLADFARKADEQYHRQLDISSTDPTQDFDQNKRLNMAAPESKTTPSDFFQTIGEKVDGNDDQKVVEEIESLCMNCGKNGITRLLLTSIPYFREIILMSFSCEECGFSNSEVQPAGSIQPKGTYYELRLTALEDFARQVVKSDSATVKFIELDLEVPSGKGQLTNVEGLLSTIINDLEFGQEARKEQMPEVYPKIAEIIERGRAMLDGKAFPFRVTVDDPAGNSFITPDLKDGVGKWEKHEYLRTAEQNEALGISAAQAEAAAASANPGLTDDGDIIPNEVYSFPATCPGCMHPCTTHMKMVDIPHFKQVVLMSTVCDDCGYRSNDVKTGGEIPEKGEKIVIKVNGAIDLARDILKSETCALECPELNLAVNPGTLGGRFTTIEGLLTQVRDDLRSQIFEADGGSGGDSLIPEEKSKWDEFFGGLDAAINGDREFTIVLNDPLASSFVQPLVDPPAPDPQITREYYERTDEEEEELGLRDMKVEGYEEDAAKDAEARKQEEKKGAEFDKILDANMGR